MANTVISRTANCQFKRSRSIPNRAALWLVACFLLQFGCQALAQTAVPAQPTDQNEFLRLEVKPVSGGGELITIQAKVEDGRDSAPLWIPMVSVLRDTLGDSNPDNDRLRYLWALSYTRPTFWRRLTGAVPFLYTHAVKNPKPAKNPPPLIDLATVDQGVWEKLAWSALQAILLDPYGTPVRASTRAYRQNITDYRQSQIIQALSLLSLYQESGQPRAFTGGELKEIQARLLLTDKTFGGLVNQRKLPRFYEKENTKARDERGHNWELLRQQAEANNLIFEPLLMPDGSATHALLWIDKAELQSGAAARFDGRFLNFSNPWTDHRLQTWRGYSERRFFDTDQRPANPETPGATEVELIPLALYGLDNPKIPALLVDFRDGGNPRRREMSRRVLQDVTRNVLALSQFGDLPYFMGRSTLNFVTGKRGMDFNQPSRLKTYAQLKLLLSLNASLEPELRSGIRDRAGLVSLNPLESGDEAERRLAQDQYTALLNYAANPDGLPARVARDRRTEMVKLEHGQPARFMFRLANVLSLGRYTHSEKETADLNERLDVARQMAFHTNFLQEVAHSGLHPGKRPFSLAASPRLDVVWDLSEIRSSLRFLAEHGEAAGSKAATATAQIFSRTGDDDVRRDCLATLSQINNKKARTELTRIAQQPNLAQSWRDLTSLYLGGRRSTDPTLSSGTVSTPGQPDQH